MMEKVIGAIWGLLGGIVLILCALWIAFAEQMAQYIPEDWLQAFAFLTPYISHQDIFVLLFNWPSYGVYVLIFMSIFLIVLGTQLTIGAPGARIVTAFAHVILGIHLIAFTYLVAMIDFPWPDTSRVKYSVLVVVGMLSIVQFAIASWLYKGSVGVALNANQWKPLREGQCAKCGRKLNEQRQCPWHDVPMIFAWLIHEKSGKKYPLPLDKGPATIGTDTKSVWLDQKDDPAYTHITAEHARIEYTRGQFFISDLHSTNGTKVDGVTLQPRATAATPIFTKSRIELADVPFTFIVEEKSKEQLDVM